MRKILTILLTIVSLGLFGQDIKPISPNFKLLQSPSFSYMIGERVWIYKGSLYGWTELAGWKNVKDTLDYYVPYRNAHDTLITSYPIKTIELILDTTHIHTGTEQKGTLAWDESTQSVETHISSDLHLNNGEELWVPLCVNNSGADILNGQPVYINSASGSDPTIRLASNLTYDESRLIGVATQDIPNGTKGRVTRFGYVNDIDLSSCTSGSNVYLGDKVLTHIRPTGGTFPVVVGKAIVCTTTGRLLVYPQGVEYTSEVNKVDGWPSYLQGEQTTLAFSDVNRTLSIIPVGSTFYFYQAGIKYIKTGTQTFQISDVEGLHYIYYNLGVYGELVNPSAAQITEGIRNYASISVIYWDATNKTAIYVGNERHTFHWPFWVRAFIHTSFWTQYLSGLGLTNITLGGRAVDADAQFGVDAGSIADEDIITSTPSIASITGLPIYYRSGAGVWRKTFRSGYSFLNDGTTGLAQYNLFSGGVWSLASMTNNYYRLVHVFANNALSDNVFCVSGIAQYASATDAENGINAEINNIYSGALPFAEAKLIGCLILHTKTGLGNSVNARFVAIPSTNTAYKDFRKSAIQGYGGGGSGSLTFLGLSDTPDSYAGQASKIVGVSSLEQGVEFKAATIDNNGSINIPAGQTYNKGGVPIIQQTITAGTTTLTASQNAIKAYADTKEPLLTKGNLTAGSNKVSIGGAGTNALIGTGASVDVNEGNMTLSNIGGSVTDAQVPNTITLDNITQITNRSHTSLTDIGTNTHPQIDTFIASKGQNNGLATLDSGGKVPFAQLPSTLMIYKGNWSPLTNTPTLADGIGTAGWVYRANLSGSVNLGSGTISFYAGDWIIYNGTTWERSVGTDNVISVNGQQGVVVLNTSHIAENTNLYYTDARSRASISENITGIDYNNTTGIFSQTSGYGIPTTTQISQIHPQGTDIQAPTLVGDLIGLTQTTTTISIAGKEDKSNKVTSISGSSTDTQYPSAKLLYDQLALKAPASGSGNYIQNGTSQQVGNFNINGIGQALKFTDGYIEYTLAQINRLNDGKIELQYGFTGSNRGIQINGNTSNAILLENGQGVFPSTINSAGYLLNGNNLFSSLSSGYLPYWDGTKFVNSPFYREAGNDYTLNATLKIYRPTAIDTYTKIIVGDVNTVFDGQDPDGWMDYYFKSNGNTRLYIRGQSGQINIPNLSGTGTRLTTASSDGTLGVISNASGFLKNDGYGNFTFESLSGSTNLSYSTTTNTVTVISDTGTDAILPAATQSNAGILNTVDKTKIDNIWNPSVQSLSGTTPTWNVNLGLGATITLSGNTSITLSNLVAGMSGTIFITNPSTAYYIKFPGYTADIKGSNLTIDTNGILCSGSSKRDSFGWYWNGTSLEIHVNKDYTRITW